MTAISYIIQVNIVFIILVVIYHLLLKKEANFKFNRYFLLGVAIVSFSLPFISIPIVNEASTLSFPAINDIANITSNPSTGSEQEGTKGFTSWQIASFVYLIISAILLLSFSIKFLKLLRSVEDLKSRSTFNDKLDIYITSSKTAPFTFFSDCIIPASIIEKQDAELILKHEKTHAKQWHSMDVILTEIVGCLLFINPLRRKYKEFILQNHEYMADAAAIKEDTESKYIELLIEQTLFPSHLKMVSSFAKPSILNRINMLKNGKRSISKSIIAISLAFFMLVIYACDIQEEPEIKIAPEVVEVEASQDQSFSDQQVFTIVEVPAKPKDDLQKFYNGISEYLEGKYPQEAKNKGIEGIVYLQFIIEKDGSLSNITPVKGIGGGCDELAVEALKKSSNWTPGKQDGIIVRSQRIIPIRFAL
ncbi:cell envelope biogenesis protein TonB [Marivirga lumbricoides]|uniref:Cell envelope biogenesis protein TonB n=1 Tax=Marivirga lumbricoides TaxID=1046115 RepID=A0ABQ1L410_9BACT|nr:cell envelope biogenesis protein TonB [Marivirga lumbricoides]